jgi:hypothetical protein
MKVIEWKPIKGFDGYFINEFGEVKSTRTYKGTKEKILKSHKNQQGYLVYTLMRFGKPYLRPLHRLLMENYKPNKENLPCINHIDGNILNNSLDNLEWCSYSHNNKEAYRLGLKQPRIKGKPIYQCDLAGNIIKKWNSANEVAKTLNYSNGTINNCCHKRRNKTYKGFIWRFVDE